MLTLGELLDAQSVAYNAKSRRLLGGGSSLLAATYDWGRLLSPYMHTEIIEGPMFSFARKSNADKMEELIDLKVVRSEGGPRYLWRTYADVENNRPFQGGADGKGHPIFRKLPTMSELSSMAPALLGGYYHKKENGASLGDWWATSGECVFKEVENFASAPATREHFTDDQRAEWATLRAATPKSDAEHAALLAQLRSGCDDRLYLPKFQFPKPRPAQMRPSTAPDGGAPVAERTAAAAAACTADGGEHLDALERALDDEAKQDTVPRVVSPGGLERRKAALAERGRRDKKREDEAQDLADLRAIQEGKQVQVQTGQFAIYEFRWAADTESDMDDSSDNAHLSQLEKLRAELDELDEGHFQQGLCLVKKVTAAGAEIQPYHAKSGSRTHKENFNVGVTFSATTSGAHKLMTIERESIIFPLFTLEGTMRKKAPVPLKKLNGNGSIPKKKSSSTRDLHADVTRQIGLQRRVRELKREGLRKSIADLEA